MITRTTFKIIYFATLAILAIVGYFLDQDRGKFFRRQKDGVEEDDQENKSDIRQVVSNILVVIIFFGLFGLVFVLSDDGTTVDAEGLTQVILR